MGIFVQQSFGNQDHTRGTITALDCKILVKYLLDGIQSICWGDALQGYDLLTFDFIDRQQAGKNWLTVKQDCAAAAAALFTARFGGGEIELFAQQRAQRGQRFDQHFGQATVQCKADYFRCHDYLLSVDLRQGAADINIHHLAPVPFRCNGVGERFTLGGGSRGCRFD